MYPIVFFDAEQEYGILFTLSCQSEFLKPNEISLFYDSTVKKKNLSIFCCNIKILYSNEKY